MEYRIYREDDFVKSGWTGGTTCQLAIFPENTKYLDRNFIWRLSSAVCEKEETVFSRLPDYDRVLMVLSGNTVLAHQDVRVARLGELEQDRFDGAYLTKSFGRITDYNLMVAKGNQGFLDVITPEAESSEPAREVYPDYELYTCAFYCRSGFAAITVNGDTHMLSQGEQMVINCRQEESLKISVMGEGTLIRAQIFYDLNEGAAGPVVIPAEKATFDDFKTCVYLANSQFRGAQYIFRKKKRQWIDEALSEAMKKIDKLYLPFFVATLGFCAVLGIGFYHFSQPWQWAAAAVGWILADIFVISPLMYFAVVPKPTRAHIKNIDELTDYEAAVRERELNTNERLDKLLNKYKRAGKVIHYDENGNGIDDFS